ncbi:acyl carrier protein [Krasilnikovia sp. M28-CT-15]|uniref:acyl carrier protein n=1 Tax=Krasilnikovia sp. M28-CT-15 TaxID=3373540 RepID=UPI0038766285
MIEEVTRSWALVLERGVEPDQHLFEELGAESVKVLELLDVMSERFGVFLTVEQLYENPTPRAVAILVEQSV